MKASISIGAHIEQVLAAAGAGNRSRRLNTICGRYLQMVADELARLDFSAAEWRAILAANDDSLASGLKTSDIWANVHCAVGLGDKFSIDQSALVRRLQRTPRAGLCAIAEATERFWSRPDLDTAEGFKLAGITPKA